KEPEPPAASAPETRTAEPKTQASSQADTGVEELRKARSSPLVRRMAQEHSVDISAIPGTGISGRVTKSDFLEYVKNKPTSDARPTKSADAGRYAYQATDADRI